MLHDAPIDTPWRLPFPFAYLISLVKPSVIKRNKRGNRGHHCLSPLLDQKKVDAAPFISTTKDTEDIQLIIHTTN